MRNRSLRFFLVVAFALVFVGAGTAGGIYAAIQGLDPHYDWVDASGAMSNQEAQIALQSVPYPLAQIEQEGGFLELRNLRERLLRFNQPNKIGYVYILSQLTGKPIGYYTIKGKISSTESQMTTTQQVTNHDSVQGIINSIGDDGSFGPEEGGENGIFFFTTGGVMIETVMPWLYSDAPLPLSVPSLNPKGKPSSVSVFFKTK